MRVIGCLCFATTLPRSDKFGARAVKCALLGYVVHQKGDKLLDLEHNVLFTSRDVTFYEEVFPFQNQKSRLSSNSWIFMLYPVQLCWRTLFHHVLLLFRHVLLLLLNQFLHLNQILHQQLICPIQLLLQPTLTMTQFKPLYRFHLFLYPQKLEKLQESQDHLYVLKIL